MFQDDFHKFNNRQKIRIIHEQTLTYSEVLTPSYVNSVPLSFSHNVAFEASASTIAVQHDGNQ